MDDALTDPRCLVTAETLRLDGANGVCRDARLGARDATAQRAGALVLVVALAAAWLFARRPSPRSRALVLAFAAVLAAAPGFHAILAVRADRPAALAETARASTRLHDVVRGFASRHRCARIDVDHCPDCMPAVRLALAGLRCDAPASIELHEGAFAGACVERGRTLFCGEPAR